MDLYSFLLDQRDVAGHLLDFLRNDDNDFLLFRTLSKSFYFLPLYSHVFIDKHQPYRWLISFFTTQRVKSITVFGYNKHLFRLPRALFRNLKKLCLNELEERNAHFIQRLFSNIPITHLDCDGIGVELTTDVLKWDRLVDLRVCIRNKKQEDLVFALLQQNQRTLRNLDVSFHASENIDTDRLVSFLECNLRLETLNVRDDLFSYRMIHPTMRYLQCCVHFDPVEIHRLENLSQLQIQGLSNDEASLVATSLPRVEKLSMWGIVRNIRFLTQSDNALVKHIIRPPSYLDLNGKQYDGTSSVLRIKSRVLKILYLDSFTFSEVKLSEPVSLQSLTIDNVSIAKQVHLPRLTRLCIENDILDPDAFFLKHLRCPRIEELNIIGCLIDSSFLGYRLKECSIHYSVVAFPICRALDRCKKLSEVILYKDILTDYDEYQSIEQTCRKKNVNLTMTDLKCLECVDDKQEMIAAFYGTIRVSKN